MIGVIADAQWRRPRAEVHGPRADASPEGARYYRDTGCELAPSCLRCHLPVCQYDEPNRGYEAARERWRAIATMSKLEGITTAALAAKFDVTARTVHRARQAARDGSLEDPRPAILRKRWRTLYRKPDALPHRRI